MTANSSKKQDTQEFNLVVSQTKDYDQFKVLVGNRKPNELHIRRLMSSFQDHYLFSPILVNEEMQIIDGQHRYQAAKRLDLTINYIVVPGYGLEEVQILNTNSTNWTKADYLKAYCDQGLEPYLKMRDFMLKFPEFGVAVSELILTDASSDAVDYKLVDQEIVKLRSFQNGHLVIPDLEKSYETAEKVMMFKPYYAGFFRRVFVSTLITLFKNENYFHEEMISKLKNQPSALTNCSNVGQYKLLLEDIYNYRRREKISLRY